MSMADKSSGGGGIAVLAILGIGAYLLLKKQDGSGMAGGSGTSSVPFTDTGSSGLNTSNNGQGGLLVPPAYIANPPPVDVGYLDAGQRNNTGRSELPVPTPLRTPTDWSQIAQPQANSTGYVVSLGAFHNPAINVPSEMLPLGRGYDIRSEYQPPANTSLAAPAQISAPPIGGKTHDYATMQDWSIPMDRMLHGVGIRQMSTSDSYLVSLGRFQGAPTVKPVIQKCSEGFAWNGYRCVPVGGPKRY